MSSPRLAVLPFFGWATPSCRKVILRLPHSDCDHFFFKCSILFCFCFFWLRMSRVHIIISDNVLMIVDWDLQNFGIGEFGGLRI